MTVSQTKSIREQIEGTDYLCLFGGGVLLQECYYQLEQFLGRKPDFICDNMPEKWGLKYNGVKYISPQSLEQIKERTLVLITVKNYKEIYDQLIGMGLSDIMIAIYDRGYHIRQILETSPSLNTEDQTLPALTDIESYAHDKWTFITGASRGIGQQIALAMAGFGSNLILHSRALPHTDETVRACRRLGVEVISVPMKLEHTTELDSFLDKVLGIGHPIKFVFNNAAVSPAFPEGALTPSPQEYNKVLSVNTIAPIRICQRMLGPMLERGEGRIINLTSNLQFRPNEMAYTVSKAALDSAIKELANYTNQTNVSLTLVDPGWVKTDVAGAGALYEVDSVIPGVLLGAFLGPEFNGHRFNAQDFAGMSLQDALQKANLHKRRFGFGRWI